MAEPLGRANVEIGADTSGLEASVQRAKEAVESIGSTASSASDSVQDTANTAAVAVETVAEQTVQSAEKVTAAVDTVTTSVNTAGNQTVAATEKMDGGLRRVGKTAQNIQSTLARVLIPVAVVGTIMRMARALRDVQEQAERTRKAMDKTFSKAQQEAIELRRRGLTDLQRELADLTDQEREASEEMRQFFMEGRDPTTFGGLIRTIFGDTKDYDEAQKKLRDTFDELRRRRKELNQERQAELNQAMFAETSMIYAQQDEIEAQKLESQKRFEQAADARHTAEIRRYQAELEQLRKLQEEYQKAFGEESPFIADRMRAEYDLHLMRVDLLISEAKQAAEAYRREMEDAVRQVAQTIRGEFGPAFLGGEQLVNAINRVATEINRRRNF